MEKPKEELEDITIYAAAYFFHTEESADNAAESVKNIVEPLLKKTAGVLIVPVENPLGVAVVILSPQDLKEFRTDSIDLVVAALGGEEIKDAAFFERITLHAWNEFIVILKDAHTRNQR